MHPDPNAPATQADLSAVHHQLADLRTDVNELRTDVNELRTDVDGLRVDVNGLRTDVDGLRTDVNGLRVDVDGLRVDVNGLRTDVDGLRTDLAENYVTKADLRDAKLELMAEMARQSNVIIEHLTDRFRGGDDRTLAVDQRGDRVEERLDAHVEDTTVHKVPRKSAR